MVAEFAEAGFAPTAGRNSKTRVFCLPAYDQADEIACAMLAQLLEQRGIVALSFPAGPTADEMFGFIQPEADDIVCISAVPPYAFTPARTMVNHLRSRFPHAMIIVGIWGFNGDREKALARFDRGRPDRLFSGLHRWSRRWLSARPVGTGSRYSSYSNGSGACRGALNDGTSKKTPAASTAGATGVTAAGRDMGGAGG